MSWLCALCATDNDSRVKQCEVCGEPRPEIRSPSGLGASHGTRAGSALVQHLPLDSAGFQRTDLTDGAKAAVASDHVNGKKAPGRPKALIRVNVDGTSTTSFRSSELCKPVGLKSSVLKAAAAFAASSLATAKSATSLPPGSLGLAVVFPKSTLTSIQRPTAKPILDDSARTSWEWPSSDDYPDREYQLQIVAAALFQNTLVSLPTGLGKTFIAAVVMYNYFRWFPTGQVVFLAPTRPLVTQQIEACYKIICMPPECTAHMQGSVKVADRTLFWKTRRVFYCTPQTFHNDLKAQRADASRVVLVVLDEAHRATKSHAYVQCIKSLDAQAASYRVLALSATPGSDLNQVNEVVQNLHISRIEVRTHDDSSVAKYRKETTVDKITVPLSADIENLKTLCVKVMEPSYNRLVRHNAIGKIPLCKLSTMVMLKARQDFTAARRQPGTPVNILPEEQYKYLLGHFTMLLCLVPALRELTTHGTKSFQTSLQRIESAASLGSTSRARKEVLASSEWEELHRALAVLEFSSAHVVHPKLFKLKEVLEEHFRRKAAAGVSSRAIIFTQTRNSVDEILSFFAENFGPSSVVDVSVDDSAGSITKFLQTESTAKGAHSSLIIAAPFVGQSRSAPILTTSKPDSTDDEDEEELEARAEEVEALLAQNVVSLLDEDDAEVEASTKPSSSAALQHVPLALRGQTQKEQVATIQAFRKGRISTLVATCIGEEGLDIGDVGIIVMFDAVKSPIRTIQRLGRTGRKNAGECICLVTDAESRKFEDAFRQYRKIAFVLKSAMKSGNQLFALYQEPTPLVCAPATTASPVSVSGFDEAYVEQLLSGAHTLTPDGVVWPRMVKRDMSSSKPEFRSSQVAGLGHARPISKPNSSFPERENTPLTSWMAESSQQQFLRAFLQAKDVSSPEAIIRKAGLHIESPSCITAAIHGVIASIDMAEGHYKQLTERGSSIVNGIDLAHATPEKLPEMIVDCTQPDLGPSDFVPSSGYIVREPVSSSVTSTGSARLTKGSKWSSAPALPAGGIASQGTHSNSVKRQQEGKCAPAVPASAGKSPATPPDLLRVCDHIVEGIVKALGVHSFSCLSIKDVLNALELQGVQIPAKSSSQGQSLRSWLRLKCARLITSQLSPPTERPGDEVVDMTDMENTTEPAPYVSQSQPAHRSGLKRLRRHTEAPNMHPKPGKPPSKKPKRQLSAEARKARKRYIDDEAGVDEFREDSQSSVDSDGAAKPGHGSKEDMRRATHDSSSDGEDNAYDLEDSFINDTSFSEVNGTQTSLPPVTQSQTGLGRIGGGGRKAMPVLARLLQAVERGEDIVDDDESLIGSEIEDNEDMPMSLQVPQTGDSPFMPDDVEPSTNAQCTNCGQYPIRGPYFQCTNCCVEAREYVLCSFCYKMRRIIHTEEVGFDRHHFQEASSTRDVSNSERPSGVPPTSSKTALPALPQNDHHSEEREQRLRLIEERRLQALAKLQAREAQPKSDISAVKLKGCPAQPAPASSVALAASASMTALKSVLPAADTVPAPSTVNLNALADKPRPMSMAEARQRKLLAMMPSLPANIATHMVAFVGKGSMTLLHTATATELHQFIVSSDPMAAWSVSLPQVSGLLCSLQQVLPK